VQFGENDAGLPSVSFPENGKIHFTPIDSNNEEECYKVEAVIVYKPSEGDNKNMENGCFRTITWDHVYDAEHIHGDSEDALVTILTKGCHENLGKGYIYILVNEKSLKDKPKSSKILHACSTRPSIQQENDSMHSLLEDGMTLVAFNHFKVVNKVEQVSKTQTEYSERIATIVANMKVNSVTVSFAQGLTEDLAVRLRNCLRSQQIEAIIQPLLVFQKEEEHEEVTTDEKKEAIAELCRYIMNVNSAYALKDYERFVSFPAMQKLLCLQDPRDSEWLNVERTDVSKEIYRQRAFSLEELHALTKIHSIVCMTTDHGDEHDTDNRDEHGKLLKLFHAAAWKNNSEVESLVKECLSSHVEKFFQAVRDHGIQNSKDLLSTVRTIISELEKNNIVKMATSEVLEGIEDKTNSNSQTTDGQEIIQDDVDYIHVRDCYMYIKNNCMIQFLHTYLFNIINTICFHKFIEICSID
jgi:hypothetical protein